MRSVGVGRVRAPAAGPKPWDEGVRFPHGHMAIRRCSHILVMDTWFGGWLANLPAETAAGQPIS